VTTEELAEKLERLDKLFVELYRYAESCSVTGMNAQQANQALRSIKNTIGNRHNVIPQAADRLRSLEGARRAAFEEAAIIADTWTDKNKAKQPEKSRFDIYDIQRYARTATKLVAEDIRAAAERIGSVSSTPATNEQSK